MKYKNPSLCLGSDVKTQFGWGILQHYDVMSGKVVISLDSWEVGGSYIPTLFALSPIIERSSFCCIGNCVLTKYGAGILMSYDRGSGFHRVRLWNAVGKGSAIGYLRHSELIRVIPACCGIRVKLLVGEGEVKHFRASDRIYVVRLAFGEAYVFESSLQCPYSDVYPALEYILNEAKLKARWAGGWEHMLATLAGVSDHEVSGAVQRIMDSLRSGESHLDDAVASHAEYIKQQVCEERSVMRLRINTDIFCVLGGDTAPESRGLASIDVRGGRGARRAVGCRSGGRD